ncbi:MAG: TlpA family protein disulfide reductase [Proteobacteria bacterium]|nr:TlpA family protein disulfide reductase [Pseudomonadota bacterium]
MSSLKPFSLNDMQGQRHTFSAQRAAIVCFIKDDCPTCRVALPVLSAFIDSASEQIDFFVVGQTEAGNRALIAQYSPSFDILDDSALAVSFAADIQIVPTLRLLDANGHTAKELVGFVKTEWQALGTELVADSGPLSVDWNALPDWLPGCGSLSVDPSNYERLRAAADNSPIRARRIELGGLDDEFEFMFDQGFSDGLPVIPPTPERVLKMLDATTRNAQDIVAVMPPNMAPVSVEKIAINCVLAGCKPDYLPVVIAAVEAVCTDDFNIHGVMATTMGATPVMVVNGPIRERIDMNMGLGVLGQGNRANATIGRALRLVIRNVGGAVPGGTERSTFGNPMKFTMCFPEWEEKSCWDALHVERGFNAEDSTVTVFAMSGGPNLIIDETSTLASDLAVTIGAATTTMLNAKAYGFSNCLIVVSPEHAATFSRDSLSKPQLRQLIHHASEKTVAELISSPGCTPEQKAHYEALGAATRLAKFGSDTDINIVVAGSPAGKCSAFFHGWIPQSIGSVPVTQKITR